MFHLIGNLLIKWTEINIKCDYPIMNEKSTSPSWILWIDAVFLFIFFSFILKTCADWWVSWWFPFVVFWLKRNHITCCLCTFIMKWSSFFKSYIFFAKFLCILVVNKAMEWNRISCMWIGSYYEISHRS